jgi:hypothetical protein
VQFVCDGQNREEYKNKGNGKHRYLRLRPSLDFGFPDR